MYYNISHQISGALVLYDKKSQTNKFSSSCINRHTVYYNLQPYNRAALSRRRY